MENNKKISGFIPAAESLPRTDTAIPLDLWGDWSISGRPEITSEMVPQIIWDFASDEAKRIGTTVGAVAMSCMAAASCAIRYGWRVQPQRLNWRWKDRPILWIAVRGNPSDKKTPAVMAAINPLSEIEVEWIKEDAPIFEKYESDERIYKTKLSRYEADRAKSDTADDDDDSGRPVAPERPAQRRLIIGDTTTERVAEVLSDNPAGCMINRDELSAWIGSFGAYSSKGAEKDSGFYLESYVGGRSTKERVGNGNGAKKIIVMENKALSVVGTIQDDKIKKMAKKMDRDGFMARFVFASAANMLGEDIEPNAAAYAGYKAMLKRITEMEADKSEEGSVVKFSDEAIEIHKSIVLFVKSIAGLTNMPEGLVDHLGKWEGLFARFCLVFHMIDAATNGADPRRVVSGRTAEQVKKLFLYYLFPESMSIYSEIVGVPEEHDNAKWIGGYIISRGLDKITAFDVERAFRNMRGDKDATRRAMDVLELASWVKPDQKDGKQTKKWIVNSRVHEIFAERAEQERIRRSKEREEIAKGQQALRTIREQLAA